MPRLFSGRPGDPIDFSQLDRAAECPVCWKVVESPCATPCGMVRDASDCVSLNSLPRDEATGLPIRSKTVVSRDADMILHKVEEVIPVYVLHQYAPVLGEKTFTRD